MVAGLEANHVSVRQGERRLQDALAWPVIRRVLETAIRSRQLTALHLLGGLMRRPRRRLAELSAPAGQGYRNCWVLSADSVAAVILRRTWVVEGRRLGRRLASIDVLYILHTAIFQTHDRGCRECMPSRNSVSGCSNSCESQQSSKEESLPACTQKVRGGGPIGRPFVYCTRRRDARHDLLPSPLFPALASCIASQPRAHTPQGLSRCTFVFGPCCRC